MRCVLHCGLIVLVEKRGENEYRRWEQKTHISPRKKGGRGLRMCKGIAISYSPGSTEKMMGGKHNPAGCPYVQEKKEEVAGRRNSGARAD